MTFNLANLKFSDEDVAGSNADDEELNFKRLVPTGTNFTKQLATTWYTLYITQICITSFIYNIHVGDKTFLDITVQQKCHKMADLCSVSCHPVSNDKHFSTTLPGQAALSKVMLIMMITAISARNQHLRVLKSSPSLNSVFLRQIWFCNLFGSMFV